MSEKQEEASRERQTRHFQPVSSRHLDEARLRSIDVRDALLPRAACWVEQVACAGYKRML
jgi:hypothetical protein